MPLEGSLPDAPNPGEVAKKIFVDQERKNNMYFSAIGFINDVKTGAFWEHSPILFDISGVRSGWGKINKVRFISKHLYGPFIGVSSTSEFWNCLMWRETILSRRKFVVV